MHHALMKTLLIASCVLPLTATAAPPEPSAHPKTNAKARGQQIERGRYLLKIAGCNDCHTPGYAQTGGKVPESAWLTGDKLGWRGPWGTTYPVNLRLYMAQINEADWVKRARNLQTRPPMPWFALHDMKDGDLRAIYRYVRSLGPAGEPAPSYVADGHEPPQPYVQFPAAPK